MGQILQGQRMFSEQLPLLPYLQIITLPKRKALQEPGENRATELICFPLLPEIFHGQQAN